MPRPPMRPGRTILAVLGPVVVLLSAHVAVAQVPNGNQWPAPTLTVLTPCGGKVGTTFEVGFGGLQLDQPKGLIFTHPGIKAEVVVPPPPKEDPKKKEKPKPAPITRFKVTIAPDVPPGTYDVRYLDDRGVSNPRTFVVSNLKEVEEKEPNNDVEQAQKIEPGTVITGNMANAVDVDYLAIPGKKGQRLLVQCLAPTIDSRMHPEMRLIDPAGRQIAYERPLPGSDGLLDTVLPADGDYLVRLNQFTYIGGGADYFYRLAVTSAPIIDAVFPPMVEPGKPAQVTLLGRNLPGGKADPKLMIGGTVLETLQVQVAPPADPVQQRKLNYSGFLGPVGFGLDGFEYRLNTPAGPSNPVLLTYATAPVVLENDANDTPDKAQAIPVPCELAGRIDKKRDRDWFVFDAKQGQVLMVEVFSHRLGAPTDIVIALKNLEKKQDIVALDDDPATINNKSMYTQSRDPAPYRFVVPADGKYHLVVSSQVGDLVADPTHVYRLRIGAERPDFRLVAMPPEDFRPDACILHQGGNNHFTVHAFRDDGFKGDIVLTVEDLPPGVTCPPQILGGNIRSTHLVLTCADGAAPFTGSVRVVGTAVIGGNKVIREARPASVTWPIPPNQNIPTLTRLDRNLALAVRGKASGKLYAKTDKARVSLGDKLKIPLHLLRYSPEFKGNFQVQNVPGDLPTGMTFGNLTFAPGKDEQTVDLAVNNNTPPGIYNLVFRGFAPIPPEAKSKPVNAILASSPVQVTVLPKQVAQVNVSGNTTIKLDKKEAESVLVVKVNRQFGYEDAFKVELIQPGGTAPGLQAAPATIGPGQSETKLTLKVAPTAPPGNRANLVVRATAVLYGDVVLVHEQKINVNVVK